MYAPTVDVSTVPLEVTTDPSSAYAPASVYVLPSSTVAGLSPLIVITGGVVSGGAEYPDSPSKALTAAKAPTSTHNSALTRSNLAFPSLRTAGL